MRPRRPMASWMVATPNAASALTSAWEARVMLRWTTPSSCMALCSSWCLAALLLEQSVQAGVDGAGVVLMDGGQVECGEVGVLDRKSTRLNSSHLGISYAVFCLKKK